MNVQALSCCQLTTHEYLENVKQIRVELNRPEPWEAYGLGPCACAEEGFKIQRFVAAATGCSPRAFGSRLGMGKNRLAVQVHTLGEHQFKCWILFAPVLVSNGFLANHVYHVINTIISLRLGIDLSVAFPHQVMKLFQTNRNQLETHRNHISGQLNHVKFQLLMLELKASKPAMAIWTPSLSSYIRPLESKHGKTLNLAWH